MNAAEVPNAAGDWVMDDAVGWFGSSGVLNEAIQCGEIIPDFELTNASGDRLSGQALLDHGPVVIVFTLGARSTLCRSSLSALQKVLPDIESQGSTLVAITPDAPSVSHDYAAAERLTFDLLADEDGHLANLFGVAYRPPAALACWLALLGLDHRPEEWRSESVPLAAVYVVTSDGFAVGAFLSADPTARVDPRQVVDVLSGLDVGTSPAGSPVRS